MPKRKAVSVRLPFPLAEIIEKEALKAHRSINNQIIFYLESAVPSVLQNEATADLYDEGFDDGF